jgi:hypothetical protein
MSTLLGLMKKTWCEDCNLYGHMAKMPHSLELSSSLKRFYFSVNKEKNDKALIDSCLFSLPG